MTIQGEAKKLVTEESGESEAGVKADLPGGKSSDGLDKVWSKLGGGGAGGAGAAKAGGEGGSGSSVKGAIEAGIVGRSITAYQFTAGKTNCQGLGGLVGLLAAYGVAGALPDPLASLASMGVQEAYKNNMTKSIFEAGTTAEASAEGSIGGGSGQLSGKVKAGQTVTARVGTEQELHDDRPPTSKNVQELELGLELSGGASLSVPDLKALGQLSGDLSGGIKFVLAYDGASSIKPKSLEAEAKASVGVSDISLIDINAVAPLAPTAVPAISQAIAPLAKAKAGGKVEASASFKLDNLAQFAGKIDAFLSGNIASVTADGAIALAKEELSSAKKEVKVTFTETQSLGVGGKFKESEDGQAVGVGADVGIARTITHQLAPK